MRSDAPVRSAGPEPFGAGPVGEPRTIRQDDVVWLTWPRFERAGRALGLPARAAVERLLEPGADSPAAASGRAPTRAVPLPDTAARVHVRRCLHGGWLAPLWRGRVAGLGRVRRELALTGALHAAGAPVPEAVFAVARRDGWLWRAAICTLHVERAVDGIRFLEGRPPDETIGRAARAAGAAVRRLHDRGVRHADLHLGNLLVREEAGGFRAWVIDLDRARHRGSTSARRRARECRRLQRSLRKRIDDERVIARADAAFRLGYTEGGERPGA